MTKMLTDINPSEIEPFWPKVAFFDLDGTVIDASGFIQTRVQESIIELQEQGVHIALATGRPYFACKRVIETLRVKSPSMFYSGAFIVDPARSEVIHSDTLNHEQTARIVEICMQEGIYVELYTQDNYYIQKRSDFTEIHAEYLFQEAQEVDLRHIIDTQQILKIELMSTKASEATIHKKIAPLAKEFTLLTAYGASHPDIVFFNFTTLSSSRENALEILCNHYQVSPSETIAFGDGPADIPFLRNCGRGVAMGQSDEVVQQAADFVTKPVEEAGVAYALTQLLATH